MKSLRGLLIYLLIASRAFAADSRNEWFRGLNLEAATRDAELIVAARVEKVEEIHLVFGGKGESAMEQFTFKPVRVLKGVFARDNLSLTSGDLGGYRFGAEMRTLKAGQMRLLFFRRSEVGYANSNNFVSQMDLSMPPLADEHDPLLQSVTALIALAAEPDRTKRVALLLSRLDNTEGAPAVPLLEALRRRAFLAAQNPDAGKALAKFLNAESPSVRIAAASALQATLENDYLHSTSLQKSSADALLAALKNPGANLAARAAMIDAVGALDHQEIGADALSIGLAGESREVERAKIAAIGKLQLKAMAQPMQTFLQQWPLDADGDLARVAETSLGQLDAASASEEILSRAHEKIAAGLSITDEISALEKIEPHSAIPILLKISALNLNGEEKETFARVCSIISKTTPDDRLVAPLANWLDADLGETRVYAVDALLHLGTADAARALRPHLADERELSRKLAIAECLGRNGLADGYAYAIEHMSEPQLLEAAVKALAAIRDPRTVGECKKIFETSNDVEWDTAAIRVLGAVGAQEFASKFLQMASDFKNPLAPAALIALGDLHEKKTVPLLADALASRSDFVVIAGARAAGKLDPGEAVRAQLAALLEDNAANQSARGAALDALVALKDAHLDKALITAEKDATLDETELLARVTKLLRERKIAIE